jgi:phosphoglucosamine mutase
VVGDDLTAELATKLGRAAAVVLMQHGDAEPVFVFGRDTRASGEMLERALAEGIRSAGGDVLLAGVQTTPAIAFLTTDSGAAAGAVISASHNPPEYNGIKFFGPTGHKLDDALEDEIQAVLEAQETKPHVAGTLGSFEDGTERYVKHLLGVAEASLEGMTVVVDCANGAASGVAPDAFRRLGAMVHAICDEPDGTNINDGCGALHPEVVAKEVAARGADAGVALDGDADRAFFVDREGDPIDGDQVLAACAIALHEQGRLVGDTVISTVMANLGFRKAMKEAGITDVAAKVGDRYVLEEMKRTGAILGGEQSGHIIFGEHATTGDGILTAIEFLSLAARSARSVGELAACMRRYPQVLENVRVADVRALDDAAEIWDAVSAAEAELGDRGRILVRASGTEPLVRVMVEAETAEEAAKVAGTLSDQVRRTLN